jgi:hypothetical protein
MPTAAQRPDATADAESGPTPEGAGEAPAAGVAEGAAEASPTGLQVADSWAEAADPTGTVKARRQMPEPDSLGG